MSPNRTRLQSYLRDSAESEKKGTSKSGTVPEKNKEEINAREREGKSSVNPSQHGLSDATPPPELGDNLNA